MVVVVELEFLVVGDRSNQVESVSVRLESGRAIQNQTYSTDIDAYIMLRAWHSPSEFDSAIVLRNNGLKRAYCTHNACVDSSSGSIH